MIAPRASPTSFGRAPPLLDGRSTPRALRSTSLRSTLLRSKPLRSTSPRSTLLRSTLLRSTSLRSLRSTPLRSTSLRSTSLRSMSSKVIRHFKLFSLHVILHFIPNEIMFTSSNILKPKFWGPKKYWPYDIAYIIYAIVYVSTIILLHRVTYQLYSLSSEVILISIQYEFTQKLSEYSIKCLWRSA